MTLLDVFLDCIEIVYKLMKVLKANRVKMDKTDSKNRRKTKHAEYQRWIRSNTI